MSVSSLARKAVKSAALPLGVAGYRRHGDVVVLLYHRVGAGDREIDLSRAAFDRQLAYLADRDQAVSLNQSVAGADGGVVVSIDDGYRDFHDHALPLLVRHGVPAVLYLATGLVANGDQRSVQGEQLTWSQLAEAVATGLVTVGAHTHSHADLSHATETEADEEMRRSKELIEHHLGVACRHFAYPWAVASAGAERAARRLFTTAALPAWRTNRRGRIDPHRLGRTPVLRSDGEVFFRAKTRGMLDTEALAYRVAGRGPWGRP